MSANMTNHTLIESLPKIPAMLWEHRDFLLLQARLVGTSMACIYFSSLASLRRPPSARPPKTPKNGSKKDPEEGDIHGLQASDAILFPILAGTVLVGLYYLIKWLEDPALLNKILGGYFSTVSLVSIGKLYADGLNFLTNLAFPEVWRAADGSVYHFDSVKQLQYRLSDSGEKIFDETKRTPLPGGRLSGLALSDRVCRILWETRHILQEQWKIRLVFHGSEDVSSVRLNDIIGVVVAVGANLIYYTTKSTFLSNLMGIALCYVTIILMSPTSFAIGSAVLSGLFFYDIYMVFYTPYMVTVATQLDIPVKLVFEGPRGGMLGLGDIVIPGMFVGLCVRFDQFLYYYHQWKLVPVDLETKTEDSSGKIIMTKETKEMVIKPEYEDPSGQWANWFWSNRRGQSNPPATAAIKASSFPKTYFHTAMMGYLVGMVVTLAVLLIYNHAQPALLYLVPGVVGAVWIRGAIRGELHEMWLYTEDGSLDKTEKVMEVDGQGEVIKKVDTTPETVAKVREGADEKKESTSDALSGKVGETCKKHSFGPRTVFAFTIEAPESLVTKN